jgi:hypothetical protein
MGFDTLPPRAWGEDAWKAPVAGIVRAWASHRAAAGATGPDGGPLPSKVWSASEQRRWPGYDLTGGFGTRADAIILEVRPAVPQDTSEYIIRTLYTAVGDAALPVGIVRLYAVYEEGRWVLGNALPRLTRRWEHHQVGPIHYVVQPGRVFDSSRAERARAFADSVAQVFAAPSVDSMTYYVADSPADMYQILGFDWLPAAAGGGGMTVYANRQLFSGDPAFAEEHRHELVHFVLAPLTQGAGAHRLVFEGLATWLGGTTGLSAAASRRAFADYLRKYPAVTLDSLLSGTYDAGFRPGGAALCRLVYEAGGVPAVKALLSTGPSDDQLRAAVQRQLGLSWSAVGERWRAAATQYDP